MSSQTDFLQPLGHYWGYSAFRPLQEKIIASIAGGHDTCVVMPTGGGKSLCYQLPAVLQHARMTVVISPLLALMQDQVDQLNQMAIEAAALNSTHSRAEQEGITTRAKAGEYRLLYVSPERVMQDGTREWLKQCSIASFVIDEAHCISEWGHDFRPDYRQLRSLRDDFPDCPIAAFTASATKQVRHDIIEQLRLRDPHKYIASFLRRNLRYWVRQCTGNEQEPLLEAAVKSVAGAAQSFMRRLLRRCAKRRRFSGAAGSKRRRITARWKPPSGGAIRNGGCSAIRALWSRPSPSGWASTNRMYA